MKKLISATLVFSLALTLLLGLLPAARAEEAAPRRAGRICAGHHPGADPGTRFHRG